MTLTAGYTVQLRVAREVSPYGYFLTDGVEEVLLHYTEKVGEIEEGQKIEVFLFHDTKDRLSATMKKPLIQFDEVALLEMVDRHPQIGSFLEMGIGRNLLLPFKEQPEDEPYRPQVGDRVFVTLAHDRMGRLVAKWAGEWELAPLCFHAPTSWHNSWQTARVYKTLKEASFVVVEGGVLGFGVIGLIHASERSRTLRLGEAVKVRVTHVREDGRVNLSMRQAKEIGRDEDADKIIAFMRNRPGHAMPYSDSTPPDLIMSKFGISKGAFKRALGKLMKQGLVSQKENWTYLTEQPADQPETDTDRSIGAKGTDAEAPKG